MRKFILLCLLVFTVSSVVFAQQMTDEQVILYVQEAQSQGKTQQEMLVELMKKGVTKEPMPGHKPPYPPHRPLHPTVPSGKYHPY